MRIVVAVDSFKGSLSSFEIINIISEELKVKYPIIKVVGIPLADGGEGSLDVIKKLLPIEKVECVTHDPFFKKIKCYYGFDSLTGKAYIELAKSSGLERISNCLDESLSLIWISISFGRIWKSEGLMESLDQYLSTQSGTDQ